MVGTPFSKSKKRIACRMNWKSIFLTVCLRFFNRVEKWLAARMLVTRWFSLRLSGKPPAQAEQTVWLLPLQLFCLWFWMYGEKKSWQKTDGSIMQHCLPSGKKSNTMLEPLQGCRQSKGDYAWLVTFPTKTSWSVFIRPSLYICAGASGRWWSVTAPEELSHPIVSIIHILNSP